MRRKSAPGFCFVSNSIKTSFRVQYLSVLQVACGTTISQGSDAQELILCVCTFAERESLIAPPRGTVVDRDSAALRKRDACPGTYFLMKAVVTKGDRVVSND